MDNFWQQDRLTISFALTGFTFLILIIVFTAIAYKNNLQTFSLKIRTMAQRPFMVLIFNLLRYALGAACIVTLALTILPGLFPFKNHVDPNLGMGGLVLFFLWPIILFGAVTCFMPTTEHIQKQPGTTWLALFAGYFVLLNIVKAAIDLVYM